MNSFDPTNQKDLPDMNRFSWEDPFFLEDQLSEDERMLKGAAESFANEKLAPRVIKAFSKEHSAPEIFKEMGDAGLLGITVPEQFGGLGSSYVTYGLVAKEIEKLTRDTDL